MENEHEPLTGETAHLSCRELNERTLAEVERIGQVVDEVHGVFSALAGMLGVPMGNGDQAPDIAGLAGMLPPGLFGR